MLSKTLKERLMCHIYFDTVNEYYMIIAGTSRNEVSH